MLIPDLFERQLASGLWEGEDGTDQGRLIATTRALADCADNKIDSVHPTYGAQVTKAIQALCALVLGPADGLSFVDIGLALVTALKTASEKQLQGEVKAALSASNLARQRKRHELLS